MNVSLILSTKHRVSELAAFLDSLVLAASALPPSTRVELIISDQNEDFRLDPLLTQFWQALPPDSPLSLAYVRSTGGLSRGRNAGLALATGDLIAFPDDDCLYAPDVLTAALALFKDNPALAFLGLATQDQTQRAPAIPMPTQACGVNERLMPIFSPTLFIRKNWLDQVGYFDEDLGVGTPFFGAGEETDLVLRLLRAGALGVFWPGAVVYHPAKALNPLSWAQLKRQVAYGRGQGKILLRYKALLGYFFWVQLVINTAVKPVVALPRLNRTAQALAYSWGVLSGMARFKRLTGSL